MDRSRNIQIRDANGGSKKKKKKKKKKKTTGAYRLKRLNFLWEKGKPVKSFQHHWYFLK